MLPTWQSTISSGGGVRSRAGPDHVRSFTFDASWLPWHLTLGTPQAGCRKYVDNFDRRLEIEMLLSQIDAKHYFGDYISM